MEIRETIVHGSYKNVRTIKLPDTVSERDALEVVNTCPYKPHSPWTTARTLSLALNSGGSYSLGWIDWEVVRG